MPCIVFRVCVVRHGCGVLDMIWWSHYLPCALAYMVAANMLHFAVPGQSLPGIKQRTSLEKCCCASKMIMHLQAARASLSAVSGWV